MAHGRQCSNRLAQIGTGEHKFWNKFKFEYSLNFKGVQTFLEKSSKFTNILSSHDLPEYEFRLTHLYSNIGSSFTSGKWTWFK
jgi:hypothetical protein